MGRRSRCLIGHRALGMGFTFGYAELTPQGQRSIRRSSSTRPAAFVGKYRKIHLPGHVEFDPKHTHQHLEKRYFKPGDLGFPVWRGALRTACSE